RPPSPASRVEDEYELMTVDEIMNGKADSFPGLIPLVERYLSSINVDVEIRCEMARYLKLIRQRATGELWTAAKWIRHFVAEHKEYNKDSVVGEGITFDLVKAVEQMTVNEGKDGLGVEMLGQRK
ncbi:GCS-domain-containing protein, partial [Aureobasidium melanogenum]